MCTCIVHNTFAEPSAAYIKRLRRTIMMQTCLCSRTARVTPSVVSKQNATKYHAHSLMTRPELLLATSAMIRPACNERSFSRHDEHKDINDRCCQTVSQLATTSSKESTYAVLASNAWVLRDDAKLGLCRVQTGCRMEWVMQCRRHVMRWQQ